jgi:ClpP class serine protease
MRFAHLLSRITGTPWFITQDALETITALIESRINGIAPTAPASQQETTLQAPSAVAMIPIRGIIGKGLDPMEMACGGADIDVIEGAFDKANRDSSVERIVMRINSPGGQVTGVPELAEKIYRTKQKPVIAVSDSLMASAAYYLASAADEIVVTPSAQVGSIGTVLQVREAVTPNSADGRTRLRVFRSGVDKGAGSDGPLTEAQAAHIQAQVDYMGALFRDDVTKARPNISAESMTGFAYFGREAAGRHLADRVVRNLAEAWG